MDDELEMVTVLLILVQLLDMRLIIVKGNTMT
jgi:hypothetical protein